MNGGGDVRRVRICAVGDGLVAGMGDPKALGWIGRVAARTPRASLDLTVFPLGVPGEGTTELLTRWEAETGRRFDGVEDRLVLGLGAQDILSGVSLPRSRLNLANILDEAQARSLPAFVVGPPPDLDAGVNERLTDLVAAFADVCARRHVPFVDTFGPLSTHDQWFADLGDDSLPGQSGYGLLAWLVLHGGWHSWLGVTSD